MSLQSYIVGKDGKVIEQKNYISPSEMKDGCKIVMAYNKMNKEGEIDPAGEWKPGDTIAVNCRLTVSQLLAINEVNKSALAKCIVQAVRDYQ